MTPLLQLLAAKHVLGFLPPEEMPKVALDLIEIGFESEALANLAGATAQEHPTDMRRLFEVALAECKIALPNRLDAAEYLKRHLANQVATGEVAPIYGASRIVELFQTIELELPRGKGYVGQEFGISAIYSLWDAWSDTDPNDHAARQTLENEIFDECSAIA